MLCIEAVNACGTTGIVEAEVGGEVVNFDFSMDNGRNFINFGKAKSVPEKVKLLETAGSHTLPYSATLSKGSKITLSADKNALKLVCKVQDNNLKPAEKDHLWTGSCVELFIDAKPFENLNVNKAKVMQYVFAAVPSNTGVTVKAVHNKATKAASKVTRTADGYTLEATIPLAELPAGSIWGADVVISRAGVKEKEAISSDPANSFQARTHYHLFEVPVRKTLLNSDFSEASFGDPAVWCYTLREGDKVECKDGKLVYKVEKAHAKNNLLSQYVYITPGKFTRGTVQFKVKYDNVETVKPGRGWNGVLMNVNYPGKSVSYSADKLKKDITGSADWKVYQMDFNIPAKAKYLNIQTGFGKHTTGTFEADKIELILREK